MLVLSRYVGQSLRIGDETIVDVCSVEPGTVYLKVRTPQPVRSVRKSVLVGPHPISTRKPRQPT